MANQQYRKDSGIYNASEAALYLNLSKQMLKYYRLNGRIEGEGMGNNTMYTQAQLDAFDPTPQKPGPKAAPKNPEQEKVTSEQAADKEHQWHITASKAVAEPIALAIAS